jgi:hypothetical protein
MRTDAVARAAEIEVPIVRDRRRNPLEGAGGPNHCEILLRDPDGYVVVLASPDGSADGGLETVADRLQPAYRP